MPNNPEGFQLKPSLNLSLFLTATHLWMVLGLMCLPLWLPWPVTALAVILLLANLCHCIYRHWFQPTRVVVCEVIPDDGGFQWRLTAQNGQIHLATVDMTASHLKKPFLLLKFNLKNASKQLTLPVLRDTITPFQFRRLRAYVGAMPNGHD